MRSDSSPASRTTALPFRETMPMTRLGEPAVKLRYRMRAPRPSGSTTERVHQVTILMSDRGLPQGYRFMNGYGSHTHGLINVKNERFWVKFHFKSMQRIKTWSNSEASSVVAGDRESAQRDLYEAIEKKDYPLIDVGTLELNRNPDNYFGEIDQAAFEPSNLVPGIGVSPDKMFQARKFRSTAPTRR